MRNIITQISFTLLLLTCGCTTAPFNHFQHYSGKRMAPTDEATLYFRNQNLDDIVIDGKSVREMRILHDMEPPANPRMVVNLSNTPHRQDGAIKLAPGRHYIVLKDYPLPYRILKCDRFRNCTPTYGYGSSTHELDFDAGKNYDFVCKLRRVCRGWQCTYDDELRLTCENILRR